MQLIEDENTEAVHGFFERPNYVSKVKHIIEFGELFRLKLEEHFGYKPSWREAYDCFKATLQNVDLPEAKKEEFRSLFKSITKFCEDSGIHVKAHSFNYKGTPDPAIDLPPELTVAFIEGLGGALICIVPGGIPQIVGRTMLADAIRRACDYCQSRDKPQDLDPEPASNFSDHAYEPSNDIDRWDNDYPDHGNWW